MFHNYPARIVGGVVFHQTLFMTDSQTDGCTGLNNMSPEPVGRGGDMIILQERYKPRTAFLAKIAVFYIHASRIKSDKNFRK